jgi:MutS domain V
MPEVGPADKPGRNTTKDPRLPTPSHPARRAPSPADEYRVRLVARLTLRDVADRRHQRLANARLAIAALAALALVLVWQGRTPIATLLLPAALYVGTAVWHDRVLRARNRAARAAAVYERGLARLEDRWQGNGTAGLRFLSPDHLYAADLDLFGTGSLFELLCLAQLPAGQEALASWLLAPAPPDIIRARQAAVEELRDKLDLREDLALLDAEVPSIIDTAALAEWGEAPPMLASRALRLLAPLLATAAIVTAVGWLFYDWPAAPFFLVLVLEAVVTLLWWTRTGRILHDIDGPARSLALLEGLLHRLEQTPVEAPLLRSLGERLLVRGRPPSARVRALRLLIDLHDSEHSPFFAIVAPVLMWRPQIAWAVEYWRAESGPHLRDWLAAVGEFEALLSLAGYAYEQAADPFPEILDGGPLFDASGMAHPLLSRARAVPNNLRLGGDIRAFVVSGSNMSGKTTLLRTVGVNAVLAFAGAPVRARALRLSPLAIGATLRIQDSLQEGRSRFFAEITRLRAIVDATAGPLPVLFLLDELLAGTNSHDRRAGAEAVVRGLIDRGAIGLVTTHDLSLAEIADALAPRVQNVHFEDRLEGGVVHFDYRVRPGVVRTSNALALMKEIGLL